MTGKYRYYQSQNLYYQIAPFIKSGFIMFIMVGLVYYFFRLEFLPQLGLFGTILVYTILETVVFVFVFIGSLIFYIITNFGAWISSDMYEKNLNGLFSSYVMALPFFKNTLISTLIFSYIALFADSFYKKISIK